MALRTKPPTINVKMAFLAICGGAVLGGSFWTDCRHYAYCHLGTAVFIKQSIFIKRGLANVPEEFSIPPIRHRLFHGLFS